jgi:transposase
MGPEPNMPAFSFFIYRHRNVVERLFFNLKHHNAVAPLYQAHYEIYFGFAVIAFSRIWMWFITE